MDIDQLEKQVEWLDSERREDKKTIADLQKKIAKLEEMLEKANDFSKDLSNDMNQIGAISARVDTYDQALDTHRSEVKKEMEAIEKRVKRREGDRKKRLERDMGDVTKSVAEVDKKVEDISKLREELMTQKDVDAQRNLAISSLGDRLTKVENADSEHTARLSSIEDERRPEQKRFADLQAEITALRKKIDEQKVSVDLVSDWQKKGDARLNELYADEGERRDAHNTLMDKMSREWTDREKTWQDWETKLESVDITSDKFSEAMMSIHEADIAVRQAQEEFNQITEQLNRRIHEITEIQRLGEERFRQEWSTFKADDQKRWTNYGLVQDEQHKEMSRRIDGLIDRVTNLEENYQDLQDSVQQLGEQTSKLMSGFMTTLRDWMAESDEFENTVR